MWVVAARQFDPYHSWFWSNACSPFREAGIVVQRMSREGGGILELQSQYVNMLMSGAEGTYKFDVVRYVDSAIQKAKGCDIANLAGDMSSVSVPVCILRAGIMLAQKRNATAFRLLVRVQG